VKHKEFVDIGKKGLCSYLRTGGVFYDIKEVFGR